jgi:hypothetical protein
MTKAKQTNKTISITPDLEAALDEFPDENWSAIARAAFQVRLDHLKTMNGTLDQTQAAIERLRASKKSATEQMFNEGEQAGAWYVLHHADWVELQRLQKWRGNLGTDYDAVLYGSPSLTFHVIAREMGNDSEEHVEGIVEIIHGRFGPDVNDEQWLDGFITGALKKFSELEEQMHQPAATPPAPETTYVRNMRKSGPTIRVEGTAGGVVTTTVLGQAARDPKPSKSKPS